MDVIDDILRRILDRIDSPITLVRAASTCKRWCRIIANPVFLRRFRSTRTVVAGDYFNDSTLLISFKMGAGPGAKDRPSFIAPASTDARRFSLDFLPDDVDDYPHAWTVVDSRGSLLLMNRTRLGRQLTSAPFFPDMFVCEPATRRYKRIPPPPVYSVGIINTGDGHYKASYLIDGDATDMAGGCTIGMSNFKVLCVFDCLFSANTAMFTACGTGSSWSHEAPELNLGPDIHHNDLVGLIPGIVLHPNNPFTHMRDLGRAGGSRYFYAAGQKLIVLDGGTGEFTCSVLAPPTEDWDELDPYMWSNGFYVADGRDGEPRIFTVLNDAMKVFVKLDGGEWALEKRVLLSEATRGLPGYKESFFSQPLNILTRGPGFVILSPRTLDMWLVSVDLETMEVALAAEDMGQMVYRCEIPWPPVLNTGLCLDRS